VMVDWVVEELHDHEQHRSLCEPARDWRPAASYSRGRALATAGQRPRTARDGPGRDS
jgi:hypothetical protein